MSRIRENRVTPWAQREVRRLIARFAIERQVAGWSVTALARETGMWPSNIARAEGGDVIPTLGVLLTMAEPMGLRLDWVPAHLRPLLDLDEFEVKALIEAAGSGCGYMDCGADLDPAVMSALRKIAARQGEAADES